MKVKKQYKALVNDFSHYFFEIIRVLDNKDKDPLKDFIANQLIEEGEYNDKNTFLKMINKASVEEQDQLINQYYCVKGNSSSNDKYVEEAKLIQWYQYYLRLSEDQEQEA